jgi:opacity protein-like surface antigen
MKELLLGTTVIAGLLLAGAAQAADLPLKAPRAAPAYFSWTGCYIGGNVGAVRGETRFDSDVVPGFAGSAAGIAAVEATAPNKLHDTSITVGGGLGCNYQTGAFLLGVEGDFNFTDLKASALRGPFPTPTSTPHTWEESFRSNWFATIRGRLGLIAGERSLFYVTGGVAFADFRATKALDFPGFTGFRYEASVSDSRVGWAAGGGFEYALSGNWSAKVEYLHLGFGSQTARAQQSSGLPNFIDHNFRLSEDVVRAGLNYRFGGPY